MSDEITAIIIEPPKDSVGAVSVAPITPIQAIVVQPPEPSTVAIQTAPVFKSQGVVIPPAAPKILSVEIGPQGGGGGGGVSGMVVEEIPSGPVDGVNNTFITAFNFSTLWVYVNGLRMKKGFDFNVMTTDSFSMVQVLLPGDTLLVDYIKL